MPEDSDKNDLDDVDVDAMVERMMADVKVKFDEMTAKVMSKVDDMGSKMENLEKAMDELLAQTNEAANSVPASRKGTAA